MRTGIKSNWDLLSSDSCWPWRISCFFSSWTALLFQVWILCWILAFFHFLFSPCRALTLSRDNFHNYALYPKFLEWKVSPVESFCHQFFQSSIVTIDYLKKRFLGSCFIRPDLTFVVTTVLPTIVCNILLETVGRCTWGSWGPHWAPISKLFTSCTLLFTLIRYRDLVSGFYVSSLFVHKWNFFFFSEIWKWSIGI